jgi:Domain of unknown function (DUF4333)
MTYPPQGREPDDPAPGQPADPDRHPTQPAPSFERPQQPGAPWPGMTQPYGPAQPGYGAPGAAPYGQQPFGQPQPYGQQPYGQPQPYAQPGFGAPSWPQPPAQKSRVGLIAAVTAIIVLAIAGVVVLVMVLQTTVLDRAAVERDVAVQFEEREGVAVELSCEDEMMVDSGSTYECTGTTADDEDVTLQIRIEDEDSAAYTWTEP